MVSNFIGCALNHHVWTNIYEHDLINFLSSLGIPFLEVQPRHFPNIKQVYGTTAENSRVGRCMGRLSVCILSVDTYYNQIDCWRFSCDFLSHHLFRLLLRLCLHDEKKIICT